MSRRNPRHMRAHTRAYVETDPPHGGSEGAVLTFGILFRNFLSLINHRVLLVSLKLFSIRFVILCIVNSLSEDQYVVKNINNIFEQFFSRSSIFSLNDKESNIRILILILTSINF